MKRDTVTVRRRELPVCTHAACEKHRVWDFSTCAEHLTPQETLTLRDRVAGELRTGGKLARVVLSGCDLRGIDFSRADLSEAFLDHCDLSSCSLVDTDLSRAYLGWSNLEDADLSRARLDTAVFTKARLHNITLLAYSIKFGRQPINLDVACFVRQGDHRPRINESEPTPTELTYRALKAYFAGEGDYDGASWAGFSERRMQRKSLWLQGRYLPWLSSLIFGVVTGYGEMPHRVVFSATAIVLAYAALYATLGVLSPSAPSKLLAVADALYFSASTFCTFSAPLLTIHASYPAKALVSSEAFFGVFAMGLFVFTLTRRYVSR